MYGFRWSKIASHLPGRTDNEIKNVWNTHLKKRLKPKSSSSKFSNNNNITINADNDESSITTTISSDSSSSSQKLQVSNINEAEDPKDQSPMISSFSSTDDDHSPSNLSKPEQPINVESSVLLDDDDDNFLLEIPMESSDHCDIWNILDSPECLIQSNDVKISDNNLRKDDDDEKKKWFNDLENELGLGETTEELDQSIIDDPNMAFPETSWSSWLEISGL